MIEELLVKRSSLVNVADVIRKYSDCDRELFLSQFPSSIEEVINTLNKGITFTSSNSEVVVKFYTKGAIQFYINGELVHDCCGKGKVTLNKTEATFTIYQINGVENLLELDVSDQGIQTFVVNSYTALTKLVMYNNYINELDLTHCTDLKYLHFHNNPICDDDQYRNNLNRCMDSLPDRSDKSLGSIVMYPWYGLETLICKVAAGQYKKYPQDTWTDVDGTVRQPYFYDKQLTIVDGKLYGVVDSSNSVTYYTAEGTSLVLHDSMNRHHSIRKELEVDSLPKNWMFGSAIQYTDEYKYCPYYFTEQGVQDVWETAEKGLGMCIGSYDQFPGQALGWNDMNVRALLNGNGEMIEPYDPYVSSSDSYQHGDSILSQIVGRGDGLVYGICPNAQVFVVDWRSGSAINGIKVLTHAGCCTSLTFSFSGGAVDDYSRLYLGRFGENNIITESAGNNGDGIPWTYEATGNKTNRWGNYGTEEHPESTENHMTSFFVAALTPLRSATSFSNSSNEADVEGKGGLTVEDYLGHYGEQIVVYRNQTKSRSFIQGTSMSSPNCNATLALMRVIYSKINTNCSSFGKRSEFMDYVRSHWMDHLDQYMSFSVGLGMPCFNVEPRTVVMESEVPGDISYLSVAKLGVPFDLLSTVSVGCKNGFTYDHEYKYFAQLGRQLVPIRLDSKEFDVYTNTSIKNPQYSSTGSPISYKSNYKKYQVSLVNCIEDNPSLVMVDSGLLNSVVRTIDEDYITTDESLDKFTIQYAVKLDINHIPIECPEVDGEYSGNIYYAKRYYNQEASSILQTICNIVRKTDSQSGEVIKSLKIPTTYLNSENKLKPTPMTYKGVKVSTSLSTIKRLRIEEGDIFVITITCDRSNRYSCVYFNGNLLNKLALDYDDPVQSSDMLIPKYVLIRDTPEEVFFYNRVLSHEEIINNTVVILKREDGSK